MRWSEDELLELFYASEVQRHQSPEIFCAHPFNEVVGEIGEGI